MASKKIKGICPAQGDGPEPFPSKAAQLITECPASNSSKMTASTFTQRGGARGAERPADLGGEGSEGVEGAEPGSRREGPRWPRPRREEAASATAAAAGGGGGGSNPRRWGRSRGVPRQTRHQQGGCLVPAPPEQRRGHPATHRGRRRGPATCGGSRTVERGLCVGGLGATCSVEVINYRRRHTWFCAKSGVYPLEICDHR
jgi:hypothetical protein